MIEVAYIDHFGNDDAIVDAARVSFDKTAANYTPAANARLIAYLARHGHFSPFTQVQIKLQVSAPIFVARQCFKSVVGFSPPNEVSRRYVDDEPTMFMPDKWRGRADDKKQGSSNVEVMYVELEPGAAVPPGLAVEDCYRTCLETYRALIAGGVAPEQARMVLPQAMMTQWVWTGSLAAWARFCGLRLADDAQDETKEVAAQVSTLIAPLFPISWAALAGWRPEAEVAA